MMEIPLNRHIRGGATMLAFVGILSSILYAQAATEASPAKSATAADSLSKESEMLELPSGDIGPPIPGLPSDNVPPPSAKTPEAPNSGASDEAALEKIISETPQKGATESNVSAPVEKTEKKPEVVAKPSESEKRKESSSSKEGIVELETDVVVGYGVSKKEDLTGSVTSVKSDEITRDAVFSVRKSLQGKAAGVHVTQNSGAPGKPVTVRIRGVGTINNSDPLYVVDGVPVNGIDYLNPNDIENISILKDASATAIYGSRGANGVVLVSTKRAKDGTSVVTYDFSLGAQQPWKKPSLVSAEEWAILNNEAMRAANLGVNEELNSPSSLGAGTDWFGEVTRDNALVQQHNVSVLKGTEDLKYFLSAGYFNQDGIIKGSDLEKNTLRFNAENKVSSWFTLGNSLGVAHSRNNLANETDEWNSVLVNAIAMDPVSKPRDASGKLVPSEFTNIKNPVGIIENTDNVVKTTAFAGSIFTNMDVFETFKFRTTLGLDLALYDTSEFIPSYYISASDNRANASVFKKNGTDFNLVLENTLSYEKAISEHLVKLLVGTTLQDRTYERVYAENNTTPSNDPSLRYLDAATGVNPTVKGLKGGNSMVSVFGRTEYDFANKYLLTFTFRRDGSSRFGPDNRWGNFPSAAGAWKVSQEPFMSGVSFIEDLKLRVGWGKTGNQEIPDYLFTTTTSGNQNYVLGDKIVPGTTFLSAGNTEIRWEEQAAYNVGTDFTLFGGKLEFAGDAFIKRTEGMLVRPTIPYIAGLKTSPMVNGGSLENKGIELTLNYKEKIGEFTSNIGFNFATYRNEILDLGENVAPIADASFRNAGTVTRTEVGRSIGNFYGYETDGLFQTQEEIDAFTFVDPTTGATQLVQPNAAPGDIRYKDVDNDGEWDKGYIGSPHPDFIYGLSLDMSYKGFDVNASFQGVYGNEIFNGSRWYTDNGTAYFNLDERMLDRWTGPGTTNDVNTPRMNNNDANNMLISDRFVEDGSFIRFKNLQVGYSLSNSLLKMAQVNRCRIYFGIENLFTFTKYSGLDPEVGLGEARGETKNTSLTMGVDRTTYPQARTFMVGLNLTI
jgi:TonB-dependent starch-binding outer membrane protein SusC